MKTNGLSTPSVLHSSQSHSTAKAFIASPAADADSSCHQCQYPRLATGLGRRLPSCTLRAIPRYTGLRSVGVLLCKK